MNGSAITKGAIISYVAIFLNIAITFLYTPWMIHTIGVSDYGLYNLVSSFIGYFILDFGMSSSIARFIAKYRAEGREDKVENMLGLTTRIYLYIDTVIFLVLFILYFFISGIFTGLTIEEVERFKRLYCIAAIFSVCSFVFKPFNGAMMAYEYFVESKVLDMVTRVGTVVLVAVALVLGGNVYCLVLINGAIGFSVSVIRYIILVRKSHLRINWKYYDKSELMILFSFSMWIFVMGIAQRFRFSLVQAILGIRSNSTEISFFALGMTMEATVFTISSALNGLFLPKVTRMSYSGDTTGILDLLIRVGRLQLFIIMLIFSGFCVFGKTFIVLWVGPEFADVYYVILLLIVSNIVSLTQSIANDYVYAENRVKATAIIILTTSTIGVICSVISAPQYGAIGCAASTCLALLLNLVFVNIFYFNRMKIDVLSFFKNCHVKILPVLLFIMIISMLLIPSVINNNWLSLIFWACVYTIIYLLVSYFFLMNQSEKNMIKGLLRIKK